MVTDYGDFKVDVNKNGRFGYQKGIKELFAAKLANAMSEEGGLIIREFLSIKTKHKMPNGKLIWISEKALYGVVLKDGNWKGLKAEDVQMCHETDHLTGKRLPPELGIHFRDFPIQT